MKILDNIVFVVVFLALAGVVPMRMLANMTGRCVAPPTDLDPLIIASVSYLVVSIFVCLHFRPEKKHWWNPITLLTVGIWRQGLVCRHLKRVAGRVREELKGDILGARVVARQFCGLIPKCLEDVRFNKRLSVGVFRQMDLCKGEIAKGVSEALQRQAHDICVATKSKLVEAIKCSVSGHELLQTFTKNLSEAISHEIDWNAMEKTISSRLAAIEVSRIIDESSIQLHTNCSTWVSDTFIPELSTNLRDHSVDVIANGLVSRLDLSGKISSLIYECEPNALRAFVRKIAWADYASLRLICFAVGGIFGFLMQI